jgi:metallo-beta-lactamase class B
MFANAALLALALLQLTIPLGKAPRQIDRPKAPIEESGPAWAATCKDWDDWDKPAPPVRIHANTYLVGTCGIAAVLITGQEGHVLIDGTTEAGADVVAANIRRLGFRLQDVRYIVHSHEHLDHVGGVARLLKLTGGSLVASERAARVFATGATDPDDPQAGLHKPFPAAEVGRVVKDGDKVRLFDVELTVIATPGHTPGALSWRWESCDGAVCRTMVFADSLSAVSRDDYKFTAHPDLVATFRSSFAKIAASPCDILLTPHPSGSAMRDRMTGAKPLFDQQGCKAYAAQQAKALDDRLAKEAAPKP